VGRPDDSLARRLNQVYLKHRFEDIELFEDVLPTLEALRKRYSLGLVSNGNSYPDRYGLEGVFRFIVFSQDCGVEKPDPKIFRVAAEKAGCAIHEMLHIGDSLGDDIAGAKNAGVRCVWLSRRGAENSSGFRADYEISSLSELLRIL